MTEGIRRDYLGIETRVERVEEGMTHLTTRVSEIEEKMTLLQEQNNSISDRLEQYHRDTKRFLRQYNGTYIIIGGLILLVILLIIFS